MFVDAVHLGAQFVHVGQLQQGGFIQGGPDHPPGHCEAGRRYDTAWPERMTACTSWSRSRLVERARRGTWGVDSKKESRSQARSSQYHPYLDQNTSTAPATGMSRSRCTRRFFRRDAMTPLLEQPGGWFVSTMTCRRPPAVTVVEMTW